MPHHINLQTTKGFEIRCFLLVTSPQAVGTMLIILGTCLDLESFLIRFSPPLDSCLQKDASTNNFLSIYLTQCSENTVSWALWDKPPPMFPLVSTLYMWWVTIPVLVSLFSCWELELLWLLRRLPCWPLGQGSLINVLLTSICITVTYVSRGSTVSWA